MRLLFTIIIILSITLSYSQTKPKIGLVLSGGGSKGVAHIGVIRELENRGIKPDYITGTSMGALIGGLYACGFSPDQLEEVIQNGDWDYLMNDEIKRENLFINLVIKFLFNLLFEHFVLLRFKLITILN